MRRRIALATAFVLFTAAVGALGWWSGRQSVTPQEAAARAEPPPPSLITVPVEFKQLTSNLVLRGTASAAGQTAVVVFPNDERIPIVTSIPLSIGDQVGSGDIVLEIAERPVFAFSGDVPAFRSLLLDSRGDDVAQLENALLEMGVIEIADSVLGPATAEAIRTLYLDAGFEAPDTDQEVLPLGEFVFVPELPRIVDAVLVTRGQVVDGEVLTVASGEVEVVTRAAAADLPLISVGTGVEVNLDDLGLVLAGEVTGVGDRPLDGAGDYSVTVSVVDGDAATLSGALARVVVPVSRTDGNVLVVPVSALSAGPDGTARVEVEQSDGTIRLVEVRTGLTAGGEVEVVPRTQGELNGGDRVVVGA